jgi:O-methyltransferase
MPNYFRNVLRQLGYDIVRQDRFASPVIASDLTEEEKEIYRKVQPYTMTSLERVITLVRAVTYVVVNKIDGDFVECGVWRGGSMMAVAHTLKGIGATDRQLLLFDTFAGMSTPSAEDVRFDGTAACDLLSTAPPDSPVWGCARLEDVRSNLASTGYPAENVHFVKGKVEDTIPREAPARICLLRLDTDWYESTKHELTHLYPRLSRNGVLIIDDYGHWQGARRATDEYLGQRTPSPFLHRIDYTGRLVIRT